MASTRPTNISSAQKRHGQEPKKHYPKSLVDLMNSADSAMMPTRKIFAINVRASIKKPAPKNKSTTKKKPITNKKHVTNRKPATKNPVSKKILATKKHVAAKAPATKKPAPKLSHLEQETCQIRLSMWMPLIPLRSRWLLAPPHKAGPEIHHRSSLHCIHYC
jgi:hypothetical protein